MRLYYDIKCTCGHTGQISMKENDQPFSKEWSSYGLKGFEGDTYYIEGPQPSIKELITELNPKCPKCGIMLVSLEDYKA